MAEVRFDGVGKVYSRGDIPAVSDFTLDVRDGEFLVLVGPSGCGKSTSLRMVAREHEREIWRHEAIELNPQAQAIIKESLGDNYETWFQHDILVGRHVLANLEEGLLYAQGIVIPFKDIMEVRQGRKDLKLVTSSSAHPFITIDFGTLPIDPETGVPYKDEIAEKIEKLMP